MRTLIMTALLALMVTACASRRDVASTPSHDQDYHETQHAQMIDGQGSRLR